ILTRGTVVSVQSAATGQISQWRVRVGEVVEEGQVLAELEQPLITKQLEQARQQLADIHERNRVVEGLSENYTQLEMEAIERKRGTLTDRLHVLENELAESRRLLSENRQENLAVLQKQEQNLVSLRELESLRLADLQEKLARLEELGKQSLKTADEILQARQSVNDQQVRVADLVIQTVKTNLEKLQADDSYLQALNRVTERENEILDLRQQLHDLDSQLTQIKQLDADARYARKLEESEAQRNIERLERELGENRQIKSEFAGRVLELTVGQWEYVTRGQRFGSIDTHDDGSPLEAVAYFKLKDGKRIQPGMKLRLTPAIAERDRFGSVMAEVISVSSHVVSAEGAAKTVGNASVAAALTKDGHQIEVFARLIPDPSGTGYAWDISDGPEAEMTFGTIASALVNLEERPPISFVIPILQHWKGFEWTLGSAVALAFEPTK
ncbi:MAG: NHLP bacteriocin system secretion protein, partial [Pirellulaceae bacterium]